MGFGNAAYHIRANRTALGFDSGTSIGGVGTVRKRVQRSVILRCGNVRVGHSDVTALQIDGLLLPDHPPERTGALALRLPDPELLRFDQACTIFTSLVGVPRLPDQICWCGQGV